MYGGHRLLDLLARDICHVTRVQYRAALRCASAASRFFWAAGTESSSPSILCIWVSDARVLPVDRPFLMVVPSRSPSCGSRPASSAALAASSVRCASCTLASAASSACCRGDAPVPLGCVGDAPASLRCAGRAIFDGGRRTCSASLAPGAG